MNHDGRRVHTEQDQAFMRSQQNRHQQHQQLMYQQQQQHEDEYDLDQLPDNADDQYDIVGAQNDDDDEEDEGQQPVEDNADDGENIDFNNYKGIYAEEDNGQKYQCPETGAHFEPKDLCKRIYKIIDKRKPFEVDLYGQGMLVDGVGSSLIASAPYATAAPANQNMNYRDSNSKGPEGKQMQVPNARAGSMKQQLGSQNFSNVPNQALQDKSNAINEAYDAQIQNYGQNSNMINMSNINGQQPNNKYQQYQQNGGSKNQNDASSSLLSEKVDKRHMQNFSTGNQKNIKFKNKFGENVQQAATNYSQQMTIQQQTESSKSPQKNRLQTQPAPQQQQSSQQQVRMLSQQFNNKQQNQNINQQNSRNQAVGGMPNQSLSMHVINNQKSLQGGNQKSLSIGGNALNMQSHAAGDGINGFQALNQHQGQSRQQQSVQKGLLSKQSTTGARGQNQDPNNYYQPNQRQNTNQQAATQSHGNSISHNQQQQQTNKRAQSHGQNMLAKSDQSQKGRAEAQKAKPKDAYTQLQEQMRAEQAKQPQNQFEHQENILKQLNSDEVYAKLMKIFEEREALYEQMEKEKGPQQKPSSNNRLSINPKAQQPKNSSAEPIIRGHVAANNVLKNGPNITGVIVQPNNANNQQKTRLNPYQASIISQGGMQQQMNIQQIPLKQQNQHSQQQTQFQQYVINQQNQQTQNSRNQAMKTGIGGRLNTKNTNGMISGGGRQNTQSSFNQIHGGKSPTKSIQFNQNSNMYNNSITGGPSGPQTSGPSGQARGGTIGTINATINKSNSHQKAGPNNIHQLSGSNKVTKKKAMNLSNPNNQNMMGGQGQNQKMLHHSQISLNNMSGVGADQMGNAQLQTFYGGMPSQSSKSKTKAQATLQSQNSLGQMNQHSSQTSKNDIIAKYMKSMNQGSQSSNNHSTLSMQNRAVTSSGQRNQSSGQQASNGGNNVISQYNNFMRSVANNQGSKNTGILNQNSGHSRNYQNQLGASSKTHTESMIYNQQNSLNMAGSFNQGMNGSIINQGKQSQGKPAGNVSQSGMTNNRVMSNYSQGKNNVHQTKKKNTMSDAGNINGSNLIMHHASSGMHRPSGTQGGSKGTSGNNAHAINHSIKPKMILNNNSSSTTRVTGGFGGGQNGMSQHQGNSGDVQVSNISIANNRPQSSKILKKKTASNLISAGMKNPGGMGSQQASMNQQYNNHQYSQMLQNNQTTSQMSNLSAQNAQQMYGNPQQQYMHQQQQSINQKQKMQYYQN